MAFWLLKSEPSVYSIDHLAAEEKKTTLWEGVRNYQARNFMRDGMKKGDPAFFYHSNCPEPGIVGVVKVVREAYPDPTALDPASKYYDPKATPDNPRWVVVDVKLEKKFKRTVTLAELRATKGLEKMAILQKGSRLSVTPVTEKEWETILALL